MVQHLRSSIGWLKLCRGSRCLLGRLGSANKRAGGQRILAGQAQQSRCPYCVYCVDKGRGGPTNLPVSWLLKQSRPCLIPNMVCTTASPGSGGMRKKPTDPLWMNSAIMLAASQCVLVGGINTQGVVVCRRRGGPSRNASSSLAAADVLTCRAVVSASVIRCSHSIDVAVGLPRETEVAF